MRFQRKKTGIRAFFQSRSGKYFLIFLEILLAIWFFLHPDLYYDGTQEDFTMRFYADSLTICGGLWVILVFLTVVDWKLSERKNRILNWILLPAAPFLAMLWLETYNHMQFWSPIFQLPANYFLLNLAIYYCVFLLLLLLCNSVRNASIAMVLLTAVLGITNYELTIFRGMSFIASDIYSALTAVSVANTYRVQIDVDTAEYAMLALVMVALLLKLKPVKLFRWKGRLAFLCVCAGMCFGFTQVYVYSDYLEDIGVDFRVYRPQYKYRYYGTLLTTVRTFGYLHVTEPEGYSAKAAQEIADEVASSSSENASSGGENTAADGQQPNVIVVMNESFADLSAVGDIEVTKDYMPYFRKLKENTIKGYTYSSVFGGNTANSEFEFLTGNTLAFLPDNSVPYQLFLRSAVSGLTQNLKTLGYSPCYALHPYYRTGYSRYKVYPLMGFDAFYTSEDFSVFTDTVNYHITDYEDYKKIIKLYEESAGDDAPFYLFNVTMQNHGSYDGSTYETGDEVQLTGSLSKYAQVEQYLNMVKMSDEALKYLIRYFKEVDEPTVIVFFGDHQPDLDETFYSEMLGTSIDTLEGEELEQLYKVPFLIWANYDIEEQTVERTSNNYLSLYLAEAAGLTKSGYQEFLTQLREQVPCINAIGYWGADGNFYETDDEDSPYYELVHQYHLLEYNNLFGKEEKISNFFDVTNDDG